MHNSTWMLLEVNSFKTVVADCEAGNFVPEIANRQAEGNVTFLILKLGAIFGHFSKQSLTQCTKEKYTLVVQHSACCMP